MTTTRLNDSSLTDLVGRSPVVPVIEIDDPLHAVPLAQALHRGGIPVLEITFRTEAGAAAIQEAVAHTDVVVGAGTLLTPDDVDRAVAAGAHFGVSPGWDPRTQARAATHGFPLIPGVTGASDIQQRLAEGHRIVKFFPAEANGGVTALKQLSAPFAHTGLRFLPTGGISLGNANDYLRMNTVLAVGGSWVAPRHLIARKDWVEITALARAAAEQLGASA